MLNRKFGYAVAGVVAMSVPLGLAAVGTAGAATTPHRASATTYTVTAALKKATVMTLAGTVESLPITVSCKTFAASGTTTSTTLLNVKVTLTKSPTISSCKDSDGGTDTVKTSGKWTVEETKSGKTTYLTLTIPKGGATFSSTLLTGCTIDAAPSTAAPVKGTFVSSGTLAGTDTVKKVAVPVKAAGPCSSGSTSSISSTVVLTSKKS
jgi:hypothetical protein